ncbi:hypothetical protein WJ438_01305 [Streptomyces sp. GD-15H]|uniref:hypothetical protein n=1 Tax=Streptomyces sp. GD-15H TaxID=3129112 RepID=UPI00324A829D
MGVYEVLCPDCGRGYSSPCASPSGPHRSRVELGQGVQPSSETPVEEVSSESAFVLHHLRPLLPDLTDEQWAHIDAAAVALSLPVCEGLTRANSVDDDRSELKETS